MSSSQRTDDFHGGIQVGSSAYDEQSRNLNRLLTVVKHDLQRELESEGIVLVSRLDHMSPDGGIWFRGTDALVAFEAKKQGVRGNAHERWFKNHRFLTHLHPGIRYVTFATGEGAEAGCRMYEDFNRMLLTEGKTEWNILHPEGCSFYCRRDGFDRDEILEIMRKAILT